MASRSTRYRFTVPPTAKQGSHSGTCAANGSETYRANALWDYNSARAHDGLPPLARMPRGTRYERIKGAPYVPADVRSSPDYYRATGSHTFQRYGNNT